MAPRRCSTQVGSFGGQERRLLLQVEGFSRANSVSIRVSSSPEGRKFRSKPQLQLHFGDTIDLTDFDFRTGERISSRKRRQPTQSNAGGGGGVVVASQPKIMKPPPENRSAPTRVICGLVRQPVTCVLPQSHDFRKSTPANLAERFSGQTLKPVPQQRLCERSLTGKKVIDMWGKEVKPEKRRMKEPRAPLPLPSGDAQSTSEQLLKQVQHLTGLLQNQSLYHHHQQQQNPGMRGAAWQRQQRGGRAFSSMSAPPPPPPPPQLIGPVSSQRLEANGDGRDTDGAVVEIGMAEEDVKRQEEKVRLIREKIEQARKRLQQLSS